ncbi:MAG: hypothetical protein US69_C0001G0053 [candidate division TM6 bacterium GW2011_GWF2_38_10]|nr:MAG: hypothetical protein US69_C0001G0053 [candidate division TM6 bacterium GW2011_GWF2_38_10]
MKLAKKWLLFLIMILWGWQIGLFIGSDTAVTREARADFFGLSGNTLYGFSSFVGGFTFQDSTTTCTYDNFFPVSGDINLHNGTLFLSQDLTLANPYRLITTGSIWGYDHEIECTAQATFFSIPEMLYVHSGFTQVAQENLGAIVNSVGWSSDNHYIMATINKTGGYEALLYYFDGATLTSTTMTDGGTSGEISQNTLSCAWHPEFNYVAVGRASGPGNELYIFYKDYTGPFRLFASVDVGSNINACAWHPSGDYLVIGTNNSNEELITYPFNKITGVLGTGVITNLSGTRIVTVNALDFSSDGNYLAVGLNSNTGDDFLVYTFSGGALTTAIGVDPVLTVNAVAYNPTLPYVAVGLTGGTQNFRLYYHNTTAGTLTQVVAVDDAKAINALAWDSTGTFLALGLAAGAQEEVRVYYFDAQTSELTIVYNNAAILGTINHLVWSPDDEFLVTGSVDNLLTVYQSDGLPGAFNLKNVTFKVNSRAELLTNLRCTGICKICGNNNRIILQDDVRFVVDNGAQLILENINLYGLGKSCFSCLGPQSCITMRNIGLFLDHDITFTQGSISFEGDVIFSGTSAFVYSSAQTSTITKNALVYFGDKTTLKYAPSIAASSLLYMEDETATLMLDNCSLVSTQTAMLLDRGHLIFDNTVTLSNTAIVPVQAITLGTDLMVTMFNNATVDIHGIVKTL